MHQLRLTSDQRRLLVGVCTVIGAVAVVPATYNFVLNPMLQDLAGSDAEQSLLRELPNIGALVVVFLAATLGRRIGQRRLIVGGSVLFTAGCALVAIAPVLAVATVGLVILSAASSSIVIVALALLSGRVIDPAARVTAFTYFAIAAPLIFMVTPVLAGVMIDSWSWRLVPTMWSLGGAVMIWAAWKMIPGDTEARERAELLTPVLAGLVLAAGVQTITSINQHGLISTATLVRAGAATTCLVVLVWCYRRIERRSLSLAALHSGGMLILLAVVLIVPFVDLWFYMTIGYQSVYDATALQTALLMVPAQLAGVIGGLVSRKIIQARGITFTGILLLIVLSASVLTTLAVTVESPIWFLVAVMSLYAAASVGAAVPVTNSIMNAAPAGEEGNASAFRGASIYIGTALGIVVMSTIVYATTAAALGDSLESQGLESQLSAEIAESLRAGASPDDVSTAYTVPVSDVNDIDQAQKSAMVDGLHAFGASGALFIAVAAATFWLGRRRQVRGARSVAQSA